MRLFQLWFVVSVVISVSACASNITSENKELQCTDIAFALQGTNTAVIGIPVGKKGVPEALYKEIVLKPGQRVIFAGPDEFEIFFKNKKSPVKNLESRSSDGVVSIVIPADILRQKQFLEEYRKNGELRFNYGIRVKGKELDPVIIVKRDN